MTEPARGFDLQRWLHDETPEAGPRGRAQSVLGAAMLASIGLYSMLWSAPAWMQMVLLAVAVVLLLGRSALPVGAILVWVWSATFMPETYRLFAIDTLSLEDWLTAAALLLFVMFALRYLELQPPPGSRRFGMASPGDRAATPAMQLRPLADVAPRVALALGAALLLLWLIPLRSMAPNEAQLAPSGYRAIVFFWLLTMVGVTLATAFSLWRWRRLTPRQAAAYVRQMLTEELRHEHTPIERHRGRRRASGPQNSGFRNA